MGFDILFLLLLKLCLRDANHFKNLNFSVYRDLFEAFSHLLFFPNQVQCRIYKRLETLGQQLLHVS